MNGSWLRLLFLACIGCGGDTRETETAQQLCDRAAAHVESCAAGSTYRVDCQYLTPDNACRNRCDLQASCEYFRGEARARAEPRLNAPLAALASLRNGGRPSAALR
jgi:hypothetical protein